MRYDTKEKVQTSLAAVGRLTNEGKGKEISSSSDRGEPSPDEVRIMIHECSEMSLYDYDRLLFDTTQGKLRTTWNWNCVQRN